MKIQVLVATMNQSDKSLLEKMNIKTDVIVGNQCDRNSVEKFKWQDINVTYLNFEERGVGLNRNNTLMRAEADVCLFADDDMIYVNDYAEVVREAFENTPDADVIIFNLHEKNPTRYIINKKMRVHYLNYLRYGTARIAVKLDSVRKNNICFNQYFGGGTAHCHGEDNLFLTDCLKRNLKIYAVPKYIAELTEERISTWNIGFDRKYLQDQGALYKAISRKWWRLLCLQDAVRKHKEYKMSWSEAYKIMAKSEY